MRPWRTTRHDSRIGRGGISLRATSIRGERLLEGRLKRSVTTQIPRRRLTRVGKGTTFSRTWKDEGRMTVSVTDRRRSNRLPWRRYANSGGTWLWIRCTSGNGCGLLIDRSQGRKGAKTAADLRHHNTRTAQSARMVALRRLHACGVGEHRSLLEAGLRHSGGSISDRGGQRTEWIADLLCHGLLRSSSGPEWQEPPDSQPPFANLCFRVGKALLYISERRWRWQTRPR
jgi:hypothetical protein